MKVSKFFFFAVGLYMMMCGQKALAEYAFSPNDYNVYSTILKEWFGSDAQKLIVIRANTALGCSLKDLEEELAFVVSSMAGLRFETINDFLAKNRDTYRLDYFMDKNIAYTLISHNEITELFSYEDGWQRFRQRYPGSEGIITFSRVGFNLYGSQALVYMSSQWNDFSGAGIYVLLNRDDTGVWKILQQVRLWHSWLPQE